MLKKAKRIGPQMARAVAYVANHPGCAILPVARHLGFTRNMGFGYDPVHRAIDAGLIVATRGARGAYVLTVAA